MQKHPMSSQEIRAALARVDYSQAAIAKEMGVSKDAVYQVIEGTSTSHRIRCCIAVALGLSVDDIWHVEPSPPRLSQPMTQRPESIETRETGTTILNINAKAVVHGEVILDYQKSSKLMDYMIDWGFISPFIMHILSMELENRGYGQCKFHDSYPDIYEIDIAIIDPFGDTIGDCAIRGSETLAVEVI